MFFCVPYPVQKYNVNINGGSDKATYYTSVGYMDQGSLMRYGDEGFRKFNMVNNINYDINNWMHVSMKTSYIRTELDGLAQDAVHGESWIGNDTQPLMPVKHPDGNWSGQGNYTNFAAVLDEMGSRKTTKNDFWNTLALKLTPLKGLTIRISAIGIFAGLTVSVLPAAGVLCHKDRKVVDRIIEISLYMLHFLLTEQVTAAGRIEGCSFCLYLWSPCRLWCYPYHNQERPQEYAYTSVIRCICLIQQSDNPSGIYEFHGICALDERRKQYDQRHGLHR